MSDTSTLTEGIELAVGTIQNWNDEFYARLPNLIVGFFVFFLIALIGYGLSRSFSAYFSRKGRTDLGHILASFALWSFVFLGFLVSLTIVIPSIQPVDLLASFGLGSLAFGFAFKDILQNWLAGLLILLRMPFRRGDQIKVGDAEGTVLRIEPRATVIRTFDGRDIVVPNTTIYTSNVKIYTSQEKRRVEINVTVGYAYDIRTMTAIIETSLGQIGEVLKDPPPQILCWELGSTSLGMKVRWWINSQRSEEVVSRSRVIQAIKEAFEANDIDPTDPQLIYFKKADSTALKPEQSSKERRKITPGPIPEEIRVSKADPEADQPKKDSKDQTLLAEN